MLVTIVVPIFNEEDNIDRFFDEVVAALEGESFEYECVLVNDGSSDDSLDKLKQCVERDSRFKVVNLRRNFGQTAALMAGFDNASGSVVISMDGDLQNDPNDIPLLVAKIKEGYDVVSGWRKDRKDNPVTRNFPSRVANRMISKTSGIELHDYGCTLKAYRRDIIKGIRLYGEMHRFIPIHASWQGAKIAEVVVRHHPRVAGQTKYGMGRTWKVLLDLMLLKAFQTLSSKPIYIFGGFGIGSLGLSFMSFLWMVYLKVFDDMVFTSTPLPQLTIMLFLVGIMSLLMGFLAELLMRTYFESQGKHTYSIKSIIIKDDDDHLGDDWS
jgi:glycosyltransferase involved in cell wall biosynthesis